MSELFPELDDDGDIDTPPIEAPRPLSEQTQRLFAQLRGDGPAAGGDGNVFVENIARLSRPGLAAGVESLRRFEKAFGLEGMLRSLKRTEGDAVELVAELDDGSLVSGGLVPPGEPAWKQGSTFGITYRGDALHQQLARALALFLARYDGVPYERILAQLVPDSGDEFMLESDDHESVFYAYAASSAWRRFFEGNELYRTACGSVDPRVAIIDHNDLECLYNSAPHDDRIPGFFNTPAVEQPEETGHPEHSGEQPSGEEPFSLTTDIQDRDVIVGADILVDQALESLAALPEPPTHVVVRAGCLPEVTGDDLEASVARTADRLRLPVIVTGNYDDQAGKEMGELVQRMDPRPDRELEPGTVALLGMPTFVGSRDSLALLERAGVQVRCSVLPDLAADTVEELARAQVLVHYRWERHDRTARALIERLAPARAISPPPPFGVAGTRRWLMAIAEACGRGDAMRSVLDEALAELLPRWHALQRRARRYRLGFVVEQPRWQTTFSVERKLGVPLLELITEMGFGIDILVFADAGARRDETRYDSIRIRPYSTCDELDAALADDAVAAWYTEMHYDRRLTRNGKAPFSMRQFRMGLAGAERSLAELLRLVELPFYRTYSRYLGRAFLELGDGDQAGPKGATR